MIDRELADAWLRGLLTLQQVTQLVEGSEARALARGHLQGWASAVAIYLDGIDCTRPSVDIVEQVFDRLRAIVQGAQP